MDKYSSRAFLTIVKTKKGIPFRLHHNSATDDRLIHVRIIRLHHNSTTDDRFICIASRLNVGDVIEHYFSDTHGWCKGIIVAKSKTAKGTSIIVYYSDGFVEVWPFLPYLGDFRKTDKSNK